ncbi:MAG: SulP family sulfate permease [Planctomycetota bacterium]
MNTKAAKRLVPALGWLRSYRRVDLAADVLAGSIVAVLLVPQAMAYALVAGLPPQAGLYASLAPLVIYALLGTSRYLAVGPVAVVSLLVAGGLAELGTLTPQQALGVAALLAAASGVIQLGMGLLRAGFVVNFISHPVISGFTSAAALVIVSSQVAPLLGLSAPRGAAPWETIVLLAERFGQTKWMTLVVGTLTISVLVAYPRFVRRLFQARSLPEWLGALLPRAAPLLVVVAGTVAAYALALDQRFGLAVVGSIPAGLPEFGLPTFDVATLRALIPTVVAISLVGFLESFAVAQSLAARRRESVDGSQELVALGVANLGAAFTGGYPVTGGFSRSMVNFGGGARTGFASIVTASLVALTLVGLTPLLFYLPRAVLAGVIVVAVLPLVDIRTARRVWSYSRADGSALLATFLGVFVLGVESGILIGILLSGVLYFARSSRPHVAVVGRVGSSEHFRNVKRHEVSTVPEVLAIRIDENLFFGNARNIEHHVHQLVAEQRGLRRLLLIASGINHIDATGLECLEQLADSLEQADVELHLAEIKGPVMDRLEQAGFPERLGRDRIHLSSHVAMVRLDAKRPVEVNRTDASPAEPLRSTHS